MNILTGWTVIGWIASLIWAFVDQPATEISSVPPGWYPDAGGTLRWWDGMRWPEHTNV